MRDFEFVWIIQGDCEYRWNERVVAAPEGSIVLCRPGGTDSFRWDERRQTRHAFFHFDILEFPKSWPAREDWPLARVATEEDILRPMFCHLMTWMGNDDPLLRRLTIAHLLTAFITGRTATGEIPRDTLPEPVDRAIARIHNSLDKNLAAEIAFADLVEASCVTGSHLCRLFKLSVGTTPGEMVRLARLDRASALVARSNYSIKEIAELCGFATPFHFSRLFKKAYGLSPLHLRERLKEGRMPPLSKLLRVRRAKSPSIFP